jgi:hypothetical protein
LIWTSWSSGESTPYAEAEGKRFVDGLTVALITLAQQKDEEQRGGACRLVARLAVSNSAAGTAQLVFHDGADASYFLLHSSGLGFEQLSVRVTGLKACAGTGRCTGVTYLYPGRTLSFYLQSALARDCERAREASLRIRLGLRFDDADRFKEPDLEFNQLPVTGDWHEM